METKINSIKDLIYELEFELNYAESFVEVDFSYESLYWGVMEIIEKLKELENEDFSE